jgi:aminopeptidase-like protein
MISVVLLYYYISINIKNNGLTKELDNLKAEIKIEQSGINSNKAVFDKLISKEQLIPLAETKLGLVADHDSAKTIAVSIEEIEKLEEKINLINEH